MMRRSCREGEINNAKRDNERTESKVHENARGVRQKETRMGKQQVYRWMEWWGPFLSSNSSSCSVKSWEPQLSAVMWCTNPPNWSLGRNIPNQKKMSSKDRAPTSEKLKRRNRIKLWRPKPTYFQCFSFHLSGGFCSYRFCIRKSWKTLYRDTTYGPAYSVSRYVMHHPPGIYLKHRLRSHGRVSEVCPGERIFRTVRSHCAILSTHVNIFLLKFVFYVPSLEHEFLYSDIPY